MLDCGDTSCRFAESKTGMRTNGGCRCLQDLTYDKQREVHRYIADLRRRLSEADDHLRKLAGWAVWSAEDQYGRVVDEAAAADLAAYNAWREGKGGGE